jgi:sulfiredoxin
LLEPLTSGQRIDPYRGGRADPHLRFFRLARNGCGLKREAASSLRRWSGGMMKRETFAIGSVYVPVKRRATLNPKTVDEIAESILEIGLQAPILVRRDGERYVLVEGLHRLEACRKLGEETIVGFLVQARRH